MCVKGGCVGAWWAGLPKVRGMGMRTMVYCTGRYRGYKTEKDRGSRLLWCGRRGARGVLCLPASHQTNGAKNSLQ